MTTRFEPNTADQRAALNAARFVLSPDSTSSAPAVWAGAQQVLRAVTARPELSGHALIGEARRMGALTLSDAHALVALVTWADGTDRPAEGESERTLLHEAWIALEYAVERNRTSDSAAPLRPTVNAMPAIGHAPPTDATAAMTSASVSSVSSVFSAAFERDGIDTGTAPRGRSARGIVIALLVLGALTVIGWWVLSQRSERAYREGVAAYDRGAREVARRAFAQAAQQHPNDARPLVFLGRITREDGDFPRARRLLTAAVRMAPTSALSNRELASVMLADGQPEIARRFYVRALQLDPTDRVAQGFLGCALFRLNRIDEARRWTDRAGPGDWSRCVTPTPPAMPQSAPPPGAGYPTQPPR
ncbi:tetratricopeptide repeat protein [Gemmatimonas sp.]|jgi:tetratricopeptide (TPR) repeat protein|uniref:tetratricopeptide repeat protein n=1 Tax=Gemmatimonas sp. TaxID=1962908 RepID=UPI0037BF98DF